MSGSTLFGTAGGGGGIVFKMNTDSRAIGATREFLFQPALHLLRQPNTNRLMAATANKANVEGSGVGIEKTTP